MVEFRQKTGSEQHFANMGNFEDCIYLEEKKDDLSNYKFDELVLP